MPRLIAYLCNDDSLTPLAIRHQREAVDFPDAHESAGFGYGWVQDGRSLLRTTPKPGSGTPDFMDLMADVPARAIIGHMRTPEDGPSPTLDLQPFRFRKWVCAHVGEQPALGETHERLLEPVPDFIRRNIKGNTASEVLCHHFLSELHQRGLLQKGRGKAEECALALAASIRTVQVEAAIADFAAAAVTERSLIVGTTGHPLYYREIRGLDELRDQPLFAGHHPKPTPHPSFKCVFVTDAPADGTDWTTVPDNHTLCVGVDWEIQFFPIAE